MERFQITEKTLTETLTTTNTSVKLSDGEQVISAQSTSITTMNTYAINDNGILTMTGQVSMKPVIDNAPKLSTTLINRVERAELINQLSTVRGNSSEDVYNRAEQAIDHATE